MTSKRKNSFVPPPLKPAPPAYSSRHNLRNRTQVISDGRITNNQPLSLARRLKNGRL
ncbi:hypothetical protein TcasGA2_TC031429 [Tribolium castaneum]|uniref:Uncharacterized protein n=1 Tax=Tribolium castaneum TaxID=7070 RepID=A0A139WAQ0_TRICA|nr:hypothetical protein TcasGA2_TC031429 [Tribolium castaneum]